MQGGGTMKECIKCRYYQLMGNLPACNKERKILLPAELKEEKTCWEPVEKFFRDFIESFMNEGAKE